MKDHDMITKLMKQYGTSILHLVYTFVRNRQTAEDLTQEIFIKCCKHLHTFEEKASIKTWLYRIAVNHCKDYLKSWHYRKVHVSEYISSLVGGSKSGPEMDYQVKEGKNQLLEDIFKLPLIYKEIILLYYFHDLTLKEISEIQNMKLSTAKARIQRAKEMLKHSILERAEQDGESVEKRKRRTP
ncbi:sigma-70 family RNA polymerase sigma factor [Neobacillus sp. CF12]|uniref:sigma-70 family RNA polymerase sigma factor n=1 Tax=Neobacillus sp. CF12 TaxID=3055864 RepID=UPI0025A23E0B|nr:sigma-70 family RNA polymerase sigma factor [Neobacillus sp. CF12]MDM5329968.1 sigma-70 family RNA polymerase sigma factor [Neobacillus sp. CF12]